MNRKAIVSGLLGMVATAGVATGADLELALLIDTSGSISTADFELQRDAYKSVLQDPSVLPVDGSVAIGIWQFSTAVTLRLATTVIDDAGDIAAIVAALDALTGPGGQTSLGPAIIAAATELISNAIVSNRQIIDVSTDGEGNMGMNQVTARNNALAFGIEQVNGVGVGSGANLNFVGGAGSFGVNVASFAGFEAALRGKILTERLPDDGATALMLGGGLLALAGFRRRLTVGMSD